MSVGTRAPLAFINLYKPAGYTSTQTGNLVRRSLRPYFAAGGYNDRLAVGHFGTLDPQATGVLALAIGKATRLLPMIKNRDKHYSFTLVLGQGTSTGDASGTLLTCRLPPDDALERLRAVLPTFCGSIRQVPPMVSARHHEGRRLYELAREGRVVERSARSITIRHLTLRDAESSGHLPAVGPHEAGLMRVPMRVACSEGTYVRVLCEDLALAIGCIGHMADLVREQAGPFDGRTSCTLEEVDTNPAACLLDPRRVLPFRTVALTGESLRRFLHGEVRPAPQAELEAAGESVFIIGEDSREPVILGVADIVNAQLVPRSIFA